MNKMNYQEPDEDYDNEDEFEIEEEEEIIDDPLFDEKPKTIKSTEAIKPKNKKVNYWAIISLVLAVLLVISFFSGGFSFGGSEIPKEEAAAKSISFINTNLLQGQAVARLESVTEEGEFYNLQLSISGQPMNAYVTKDGELLFPQAIDLSNAPPASQPEAQPAAPNVVKSDKPVVELFVMSHCPYGTQAEKGILPAVEKLGDKIDFDIKFVYYAMHGKEELDEELNQYCIKKEQEEKFFPYLKCFLNKGESGACATEAGVDLSKLRTCVSKTDTEYKVTELFNDQSTWLSGRFPLFNLYKAENERYGVRGSPTLVINGQEASSGRSPAEYLTTICASFNEAPGECDAKLSATSYSPGFGYDTTGAATTASCG